MAKIKNPRKSFNFSFEILDPEAAATIDPYLAQEVIHPDEDIEPVPHGDVNFDVKTAGRVTIGNATINKLKWSAQDYFIRNWRNECQIEGIGGSLPSVYKKDIKVTEFAENHESVIEEKIWRGAWPTKINGQTNSRIESENTIESVEFSVDRVEEVAIGG